MLTPGACGFLEGDTDISRFRQNKSKKVGRFITCKCLKEFVVLLFQQKRQLKHIVFFYVVA